MPGISQKWFHSMIRGRAAEALEILAAHSESILTIWRRHVAEPGICEGEWRRLAQDLHDEGGRDLIVALYRSMQRALANVLKHAAVWHVTISLKSMKESVLVMTVEDVIVGFDAVRAPAQGVDPPLVRGDAA